MSCLLSEACKPVARIDIVQEVIAGIVNEPHGFSVSPFLLAALAWSISVKTIQPLACFYGPLKSLHRLLNRVIARLRDQPGLGGLRIGQPSHDQHCKHESSADPVQRQPCDPPPKRNRNYGTPPEADRMPKSSRFRLCWRSLVKSNLPAIVYQLPD
jgi:hypothetical protein